MEHKIKVLVSKEQIEERTKELAAQISREYEGEALHLICILKGSVFFTCALANYITVPVTGEDIKGFG